MDGSDKPDRRKGFSAHVAGQIERRCQPQRAIAAPAIYTVRDKAGEETTGRFAVIKALCPDVKVSTLKLRLDNGERTLEELRRPPSKKPCRRTSNRIFARKKP
jgi:hypothetical protein